MRREDEGVRGSGKRARHWRCAELPGVGLLRARYVHERFVRRAHEHVRAPFLTVVAAAVVVTAGERALSADRARTRACGPGNASGVTGARTRGA